MEKEHMSEAEMFRKKLEEGSERADSYKTEHDHAEKLRMTPGAMHSCDSTGM